MINGEISFQQMMLSAMEDGNKAQRNEDDADSQMAFGKKEKQRRVAIDFQKELDTLKKRTQVRLPNAYFQAEDHIFLSEDIFVTLEYIFYPSCQKYKALEPIKTVDSSGNLIIDLKTLKPLQFPLGTERYQQHIQKDGKKYEATPDPNVSPMSIFNSGVVNYQAEAMNMDDLMVAQYTQQDFEQMILDQEDEEKAGKKLNDEQINSLHDEYAMVEGILTTWQIGKGICGMQMIDEERFITGLPFAPTDHEDMRLRLTDDGKVLSLIQLEKDTAKIMCWDINGSILERQEDNFKELETALANYRKRVGDAFSDIIDINFLDKSQYLLLKYIHKEVTSVVTLNDNEDEEQEQMVKRHKKFVLFDRQTGTVVIDCGDREPFQANRQDGETTPVFVFDVIPKGGDELAIFLAGNLLEFEDRKPDDPYDWTMTYAILKIHEFCSLASELERAEFVQFKLLETCSEITKMTQDIFRVRSTNFTCMIPSVSVSVNDSFEEFGYLNDAEKLDAENPREALFFSSNAQLMLAKRAKSFGKKSAEGIDRTHPLIKLKLLEVGVALHARNFRTKQHIYINDFSKDRTRGQIVLLQVNEFGNVVSDTGFRTSPNNIDCFDCLIMKGENAKSDRTFSLNKSLDNNVILTTKDPQKFGNAGFREFYTNQFRQKMGSHPVVAYNLGLRRIAFQSSIAIHQDKIYILNLDEGETFQSFVGIQSYDQIGFYPDKLQIECCSNILILIKDGQDNFKMKLVVIDPFNSVPQVASFQSTFGFSQDSCPSLNGYINQCLIQSYKEVVKGKTLPKVYLVAQLSNEICRVRFVKHVDCSKKDTGSSIQSKFKRYYGTAEATLEKVTMIQGERQNIFYVGKVSGTCHVVMISYNAPEQKNDASVYQFKSECCRGLSQKDETFYIMDESYTVHRLLRIQQSVNLKRDTAFSLRLSAIGLMMDKKSNSQSYDEDVLLHGKWVIQARRVLFPFKEGAPRHSKLLEPEDLLSTREEQNYNQNQPDWQGSAGFVMSSRPIPVQGSNEFIQVFRFGKLRSYIKIFQKPDSTCKTLMQDFQYQSQFSTFLGNGDILIGTNNRTLMFNSRGEYLYNVGFQDKFATRNDFTTQEQKAWEKTGELALSQYYQQADNLEKCIRKLQKADQKKQGGNMVLLKTSDDNKSFLYFNTNDSSVGVYALDYQSNHLKNAMANYLASSMMKHGAQTIEATFKLLYKLDIKSSPIIKQYRTFCHNQSLLFFLRHVASLWLENTGEVSLSYVQHLSAMDKREFRVLKSRFQMNKPLQHCEKNFSFNEDMSETVQNIYLAKKQRGQKEIQQIKIMESLVKNEAMRNYTELKLWEMKQFRSDKRMLFNMVESRLIGDEYVVVWCANKMKIAKLAKGKIQEFEDLPINFSENVEIFRLATTCVPGVLQILANDVSQDLQIMLTWNFRDNMEVSNKQMYLNPLWTIESYLTMGMNQKMNYYLDPEFLIDMEYCIPYFRNTASSRNLNQRYKNLINQNKQIEFLSSLCNQLKLYKDQQKFLGLQKPCTLNYTMTQMNFIYWRDFNALGEEALILKQNFDIEEFKNICNGYNFFHYYSGRYDIMKVIHDKFKQMETEGNLTAAHKRCPMMILGTDSNGHTALQHCIDDEQWKNFRLMLKMVMWKGLEYTVSKLIIDVIPTMLDNSTEEDMEFFENCMYRPFLMSKPITMRFDGEEDEYLFTSNTSIIDAEIIKANFPEETGANENADDEQFKNDSYKEMNSMDGSLNSKNDGEIKQQGIMQVKLKTGDEDEDEGSKVQKLYVEALDFDWLFENNNAKNLITVLTNSDDHQVLTTKSIKIFLSFMWNEYQIAIIKFIFLPTLLNTFLFIILCCGSFEAFLDEKQASIIEILYNWFLTLFCLSFTIFNLKLELAGLTDIREYFGDYWNILDFISLVLNFFYLSMVMCCLIKQDWVFERHVLQNMGAFACFLVWIKMFYWMRLFSTTAYYVKLITQTIWDCKDFMLMVLIIMIAFACFFFMINLNQNGKDMYVDDYIGHGFLDAMIASYFICLGEFGYDNYAAGQGAEEKYMVWGMFILGSFLCCIVFMNMLIAIMGDTFGAVQEAQEMNGLVEQLALINDFIWLIDIEKKYKGSKYLIRVTGDLEEKDEDTVIDLIKSANVEMNNNFEKVILDQKKLENQLQLFAKSVNANFDELKTDNAFLVKSQIENDERRINEEAQKKLDAILQMERRSKGDRVTSTLLNMTSDRKASRRDTTTPLNE